MAMNLSSILGFGAHEPLVDLEDDDEIGAAARTPALISAATPPTSSPSLASPSFGDTILGLAPDEGRNFRRSLAGGLSAAAANYGKPAMAAAMASFGGALGAGKGEETGFQRKIDTLDRAIRAHRIGDMDEVRRALAELLQAQRASQTAQYGMPNAGAMAPAPTSTWRSTFYDNILGMPLIGIGDTQPVPNDRAPDRLQARGVAAAPPNAGADLDHDAVLDEALRAAGVPTHRLEPHHLVGAAHLMAKQGLTPADAYERFVMQSVRDGGLFDDGDFHYAFGTGASDEIQRGGAPADVAPFVPAGGADGQRGAPPGDAQAGARVRGLDQAGGGGAIGGAFGTAGRGSEGAPLVRIGDKSEAGAPQLVRSGVDERGVDEPESRGYRHGAAYAQARPDEPFGGRANPTAGEHLVSQFNYLQAMRGVERGVGNSFEVGAYTFVTRGRAAAAQFPDGFYVVVTSPTYGYDPNTGAYATFDASPNRPFTFTERNGVVTIRRD